jgi:hypothetical protein
MREYTYSVYGALDDYGQPTLEEDKGVIKMAINITSQSVQNNIVYQNANYIGLTFDNDINDTYVINYNDTRLKVLYVNKHGRYNQVFMGLMNG